MLDKIADIAFLPGLDQDQIARSRSFKLNLLHVGIQNCFLENSSALV